MASTTYHPATKDDRKGNESWEKAKDAGKETLSKAKDAGQEALDKAREVGEGVLGKVKEAGAHALDTAKGAAHSVGETATETAAAVGKKADDMTAAAGHGIAGFGETIAQKAPHEGLAGRASQAVADTIKESGRYIEEQKLSGMAQDVEQFVKNHPIPTILVVLGIGFCLGRAMKD